MSNPYVDCSSFMRQIQNILPKNGVNRHFFHRTDPRQASPRCSNVLNFTDLPHQPRDTPTHKAYSE